MGADDIETIERVIEGFWFLKDPMVTRDTTHHDAKRLIGMVLRVMMVLQGA